MEAGLSARDTMNALLCYHSLSVVEVAARHESQRSLLLECGVADALEYTCLNDFQFFGISLSAVAAGGAVALLGRNEGGKTLSREAVFAVLDSVAICFQVGSWQYERPMPYATSNFARVVTMCISDANKRAMVQYDGLVQMLLDCLVLDASNPRHGQDGVGALQESCAGVFQELALFGPSADLLRSHAGTVDSLRALAHVGSVKSQECASAALFELEDEKRTARMAERANADGVGGVGVGVGGGDGSVGKAASPPPHVMASYNWDHQDVILRVVASLQGRGYLVWVDTEQMKGASVDTMALAVEGSEVVLIGVSRAYKESSNCRMEAQYALQKKKALIPLMLVHGYEADGWLGLLLGTSIWYAFHGEMLSSEVSFESRVDALCRELGCRGRADADAGAAGAAAAAAVSVAVGAAPTAGRGEVGSARSSTDSSPFMLELRSLKFAALQQRALSLDVDGAAVDDAVEADNPKAALIALIVAQSSSDETEAREAAADELTAALSLRTRRAELEALRVRELVERAQAIDLGDAAMDAMDASGPKEALIGLLLGARK